MNGNCEKCGHRKGMINKKKGVRIPGGSGKCTRPGGLCVPSPIGAPGIGGVKITWKPKRKKKVRSADVMMKLTGIYPNPEQPRKSFPQKELDELAANIKTYGLLEPIVVVKRELGCMIVAGERRWRACQLAGLEAVPVRIIEADAKRIAALALLENVFRQDLNILEEARGFQALITDHGMTAEEIATQMGFKQPWRVQERLNLLRLDPAYQDCVVKNILTPSQAQELSRLPLEGQRVLFNMIRDGKADTYNKLRSLANAILYREEQVSFLLPPDPRQAEVKSKYDRMLDGVLRLISGSFSSQELGILQSVLDSSLTANIEKIDLVMGYLQKIKKALLQAESTREVTVPVAEKTLDFQLASC